VKIKSAALEFILGVSKKFHPREFGGMLRGRGDLIEEVLIIPATTYGEDFVSTRLDMVPIDRSVIGSFHSHPGPNFRPSDADIAFFGRTGRVHLIVKSPFKSLDDVAAYDGEGKRIDLEVV
jgi:proteasome lid subunit RPN8/RPN11